MEEPIDNFYNSDNMRFSLLMRLQLYTQYKTFICGDMGRHDQHEEPCHIWTFALTENPARPKETGLYARNKYFQN